VDLYPRQFDESYPLPSFNTRDLDTVDNGVLERLPLLLKDLRMDDSSPKELEVVVSHFLGVDHVGHTYGPHDKHMTEKLNQMDVALSTTLDVLDSSKNCHLALIFGGVCVCVCVCACVRVCVRECVIFKLPFQYNTVRDYFYLSESTGSFDYFKTETY
jgi:predicted AlkP superfamily pyrophosphatase or phosphodiesterase